MKWSESDKRDFGFTFNLGLLALIVLLAAAYLWKGGIP